MFPANTRILFQGDSITDGNRGRDADLNHILGHGYAFIIAAKLGAQFPECRLDFMNRGIGGNTVRDLEARWQQDTLDPKPDVLSILIGVNDIYSQLHNQPNSVNAQDYERIYDGLLCQTLKHNPQIRFVICEPFVLPVSWVGQNWEAWQREIKIRQEIAARLAERYQAPFVRFQKVFDEACAKAPGDYWIWDGIHPTYSGHQLMADEWMATLQRA